MPNTLAHIGVQAIVTRRIIKAADFKWILIGCVIPDVPWIIRRVIVTAVNVDPYDLRLYAIVQSTLFFCLILSFLLSSLSKSYWRTFFILGSNSLFHLVMDALQTKWGNGVHLFAPFSWKLCNFNLFWPESLPTYTITALGLAYFGWICFKGMDTNSQFVFRPVPFLIFLPAYFVLPLLFFEGPEFSNNHYIETLRFFEARQGKYIEIDRARHITDDDKIELQTFAGEKIKAEGISGSDSAIISIQGTFVDNNKINVSGYHFHSVVFRDLASYIGLALVGLYWLWYGFSVSWYRRDRISAELRRKRAILRGRDSEEMEP